MQIQKQLGKKTKDKVYPKYVVVIPPHIIEASGLKEGEKLDAEVKNGEIRLRRREDKK